MTYSDWSGNEQEDGELAAMRQERRTLETRLEAVERRLATVEAQLQALDESFVRHQTQNETDLDHLTRTIDRVGQDLDRHSDAHWRSGR